MYVHIRVPAYDMPTVRYEVIRLRHIYKSIVHVPAVSKKEGVDWMVEGAVDGIESTMSSIAFNRAALSGLWEVLSSGKRIRLALSTRSLTASFSASTGKKHVESFWNHCVILQRITHKSHASDFLCKITQ